jgi:tRNA threonylcarbamoyladenosine biosynthesis protein TsaE
MNIEINTLEDLPSAAMKFLEETDNRKVFAFNGQMGAGKTTFIVSLLTAMGVEDIEGSPTYSLVNTYETPAFGKIFHFDLYRLNSEEEAFDIGIEEMLYGGGYCFIEWPEKIPNLLPENTISVQITTNEEGQRVISIDV